MGLIPPREHPADEVVIRISLNLPLSARLGPADIKHKHRGDSTVIKLANIFSSRGKLRANAQLRAISKQHSRAVKMFAHNMRSQCFAEQEGE